MSSRIMHALALYGMSGVAASALAQPVLQVIEPLEGTTTFVNILGMSADGQVLVGVAGNSAVRWTQETGSVALQMPPGITRALARQTNADGSVVVGSTGSAVDRRAFRWT